LLAYLAGDGYPSEKIFRQMLTKKFDLKEKITLATASKELSIGLQYLLSSLGYSYSAQKTNGEKREVKGVLTSFSENYRIEFYTSQKNSPLNFYPLNLGGINAIIEPKLKYSINKRGQQTISYERIVSLKFNDARISEDAAKFIEGDLGVVQISSIKERLPQKDEYVYDYSVDGDENFVGGIGAICLHNSLDACEEAGILPDIEVQISELGNEYLEVTVKDNGPGLTEEVVGKALGKLLAGTKFHRMIQMRGQQGIGAAGVTMLSQITTGKSVKVVTGTKNSQAIALELNIDAKKNEPKISNLETLKKPFQGLMVKAPLKGVKYVNSEQAPLEYLRRTAIANPHARIKFIGPDKQTVTFERSTKEIPKRPIEIKPHPKGATVDEVATLAKHTEAKKVSTFLKTEFDRVGDKAIEEIAKGISFDPNKDPRQIEWEEAEEIVKMFKKISFIAPRTDGLIPIGEDRVKKSLQTIVEPEYMSVITRKPQVYSGGFPFQVEVSLAYGGKAGRETNENTIKQDGQQGTPARKIEIMRFANRVPLLFDSGACAITKAVQSIDWKRYGIKDFENAPMTVFVNLISVHIPYTSTGKQAISDEEEIMEELRLALMEAGRKTGMYISSKLREQEKQNKRRIFMKYAKEVAIGLHELTKKPVTEIEKKLLDIVMHKLKLEEAQEAKEIAPEETQAEEQEKQEKRKKKTGSKNKKKIFKEGED
ncbi:MAG: DNA topoisomerase VI subunit B, partial [Candidatus Diapherotrites archaeon]|nr:DNA topoisomerase VI subunit B [Candidatus Diapherotrites archaeon]